MRGRPRSRSASARSGSRAPSSGSARVPESPGVPTRIASGARRSSKRRICWRSRVKVWVNGELGRTEISVLDHGITVGDGVFETIKLVRGVPFALTRHLDRLAYSARGMGLDEPDQASIRAGIDQVLQGADWELGRLRITYTGGPGPLGSDRGPEGPTTIIFAGEQKPFPATAKV